jgi:hypothetical protein
MNTTANDTTPNGVALHYLGGFYIHGVPARDLTADEAEQYRAVIKAQEKLTGLLLYEPVRLPRRKPFAAPDEAQGE